MAHYIGMEMVGSFAGYAGVSILNKVSLCRQQWGNELGSGKAWKNIQNF